MNYYLKHPIQLILSFFGYVKASDTKALNEAIMLSLDIEKCFERLHKKYPRFQNFKELHEAACKVTWFLRSGRLISFKE